MSTWSNDGHFQSTRHTEAAATTLEEKRRIVEETSGEGASVARVARAHGVNANHSSSGASCIWQGDWETAARLSSLPVRVNESLPSLATLPRVEGSGSTCLPGTIHIELRRAQVRIESGNDPGLLRVLLECLRG